MGFFNGKNALTLFWGSGHADGSSNVRLYLGEKLVYMPFRPPEGDLLLAGKGVYLKSATENFLSYKNEPQIVEDRLSGKNIGAGAFELSFEVAKTAITQGTTFLLTLPGVLQVKSEKGILFFRFSWTNGWKYVPATSLTDGWNTVRLKGDGAQITLSINGAEAVVSEAEYPRLTAGLLDVRQGWTKLKNILAKGE